MRVVDRRWACASCGSTSEPFDEDGPMAAGPLLPAIGAPDPIADGTRLADNGTDLEAAFRQAAAESRRRRGASPGPPQARLAGRRRSFGTVVVLGLVTFGLYWLHWQWQAFREVHLQEGTPHRPALFWAAVAASAAGIVAVLVLLLTDAIQREAVEVVAAPFGVAAWVLLLAYLLREGRQVEALLAAQGGSPPAAQAWLVAMALFQVLGALLPGDATLLAAIPGALFALVAYGTLQRNLNEYWGLRESSGPTAPTALTPAPS
jgi:hypothetical protein